MICHRSPQPTPWQFLYSSIMDEKLNFLELFGICVECYITNGAESEQNKKFQAKFQSDLVVFE
jgi:hypothetical protein